MEPLKSSHDSESWFKMLKMLHSSNWVHLRSERTSVTCEAHFKRAFLDSQRACVMADCALRASPPTPARDRLDPSLDIATVNLWVCEGFVECYRGCSLSGGGDGVSGRLHLALPRTQPAWDEASSTTAGSHLFCEPSNRTAPRRSVLDIPNTHLLALALKQLHAATAIPLVCYLRRGIPAPCVWDVSYPQCNVLSYKKSFVRLICTAWLSGRSCFQLFSHKTSSLICLWVVSAWFK